MHKTRVLVVEDDTVYAEAMKAVLKNSSAEELDLRWVDDLEGALDELRRHPPACVVLDLNLPDSEGLATLARVREAAPDLAIVVLTGEEDVGVGAEAIRRGAMDYLVKGEFGLGVLGRSVRHSIERKKLERKA